MLRKIQSSSLGVSDLGWLRSKFHFSFAEYYDPKRMGFGVLRVINDDLIAAGTGFGTHPHRDMEIISYVVDGELSHADSMGNKHVLQRGQVQYMSAGTGVTHSEHNLGDETARFLQIWILPDQRGHVPNYGDFRFEWQARENKWLHMVSSLKGDAPVKIHQDVNFYALSLDEGKRIEFDVAPGRQAYLVQIEGESVISGLAMKERDGLEIYQEPIEIIAQKKSHFILIEMEFEGL